jgi:hypothetical protein
MLERFKKEYEIDYAWGKEQGTFFWLPDLADEFLRFFEEQGMQPPPYTFKQKVVNNPTGNTISVTNYEWEDHDRPQD